MKARTSLSHPLRIAEIAVGTGAIGITFCPGKHGDSVFGAPWARDLEADLDVVQAWGATTVVTLVETHELVWLKVPDLGQRVRERGLQWLHLPIVDQSVPGKDFETAWPTVASQLRQIIAGGDRALVHCRGGLGRAGTVAACLLVDLGVAPSDAVNRVRAERPNAIETAEQLRYVLGYRPGLVGAAT